MSVTFRVGGLIIDNGDTLDPSNLPIADETTLGGVIIGQNISIDKSGAIGVANSSTSEAGIVRLNDTTTSASTTLAATANAVKTAYDLAAAALPLSGGTMTGAITFAPGQSFPVSGIPDATTGVKGVVQIGDNIQVSSGTISVLSSSTSQAGVVQLNDTVASTSTTQALTANQGKNLQDQINALSVSSNITFAGTINGSTGNIATVTTEGAAVGFAVGSPLPSPSATIAEYFVIVSTAGTMTPPGGSATAVQVGDWWLASATTWTYIAAGYTPPAASTSTAGIIQLATNAEVQAGVVSTEAVVPSALQSKMSDSTSTTSSTTIASSTAVKSAYDLANAALPKAGGTMTGDITFNSTQIFPISGIQDATTGQKGVVQVGTNISVASGVISVATAAKGTLGVVSVGGNIDVSSGTISVKSANTSQPGVVQLVNSTSSISQTLAPTAAALSTTYSLANAALPKAGGTMTGNITFQDAGEGLIFSDASNIQAISDSTSTTSSVTAASATAVKSAYDLANAALPKAGGTMTGNITFQDAGEGLVFSDTSNIQAISDSTSTTSSVTAASSTAEIGRAHV